MDYCLPSEPVMSSKIMKNSLKDSFVLCIGMKSRKVTPTPTVKTVQKAQPKGRAWPGIKCKRIMTRDTAKFAVRVVGVLISSCGFLYQTSQLFSLYLSGKISVDNRVERLPHSELPAITICLPTFIDMDKFAEYLLKNSTVEDYQTMFSEYDHAKSKWNDQEQKKWHDQFIKVFPNMNVSIIEIFDKISIQNLNLDQRQYFTIALNEQDQIIKFPKPVFFQSLVPFSDPRKCFTMFTAFDENFRAKKFKLIKLELLFTHDNSTFPDGEYLTGDFHIALHSANTLPVYIREESFKNLKMGKVNVISYSEIRTTLLPAPYDTDCRDYQLDNKGEQNMRSDCIQKCIDRRLLQQFSQIKCIFTYSNFKLIRRENLSNLTRLRFCNYFSYNDTLNQDLLHAQINFENECSMLCYKNCFEVFYDFTIDSIKGHSWVKPPYEFAISIQHNRFPDQIVSHKPIMRWIELVSNFGGLLGMWLGLSIAFLFDYFIGKI